MSFEIAQAFVTVTADASKVGDEAGAALGKQQGVFAKMGTIAGGIIGAQLVGAAASGLKSIFTTGFHEYLDADAITAQFRAGLQSTGNVAGVTVEGMNKLASSIQAYSGQTDDSIAKTESLLLTFTNIRNVGPDKIFDQATVAAADMAAKLGGDASASAIQLGKALNDPTAGITALTRVGVSFTEQQKDQIKTLQASGDVLGAQKIILGELNKEFGGSAAAAGATFEGTLQRIKRGFEDVTQAVVGGFMPLVLPALNVVAGGLSKLAGPAEEFGTKLGTFISGIDWTPVTSAFQSIGGFVGSLVKSFEPLIPTLLAVWQNLSPVSLVLKILQPLLPVIAGLVSELANTLGGALKSILPVIIDLASKLAATFSGVLAKILPVVVTLIESLLKALTPLFPILGQVAEIIGKGLASVITMLAPLLAQIIAQIGPMLTPLITALIPVIELLVTAFGQILKAVMPLVSALITALLPAIVPLIGALLPLISTLITALLPAFQAILSILTPVIDIIVAVLVPVIQVLGAIITWLVNTIVVPLFNAFGQIVTWLVQGVTNEFNIIGAVFTWLYNNIIKPVFDGIAAVFNWWMGVTQSVTKAVGNAFNAVWTGFIQPIANFIGGAINTVGSVVGTVFGAIGKTMTGAFTGVEGAIRSVINGVIGLINGAIGGINTLIKTVNNIPGVHVGLLGKLPGLATGGNITGSGSVLVGENGPEVLNLNRGAQVVPLDRAGSGGGGVTIQNMMLDVSKLKSVQDIIDFFDNLGQAARQGRGNGVAG